MAVDVAPNPGGLTLSPAERSMLVDACRASVERARVTGRHALVSWAHPYPLTDPFATWAAARTRTGRSLYWQSAWDGSTVLAFGSAHDLRGTGAGRIAAVRSAWSELVHETIRAGPTGPGRGPLALGGFAFGGETDGTYGILPDALLWVPLMQVRHTARDTAGTPAELRLNALVDGSDDPELLATVLTLRVEQCFGAHHTNGRPPTPRTRTTIETPAAEEWKDLVRRATARIRAGDFEKVVLARRVDVTADRELDIPAAVHRMRETHAGTTVFALGHGDTTFLGATPEYLVRVEDREVHALGLAGTTPRGATPAEDRELEAELSGSAKLRHEHDVVVRMLSEALTESCTRVTVEAEPQVLKLAHVQHLSTPVRGRLVEGSAEGVLDLAARLHPTPALGGHPRAEALAWLTRNEGFDRGWYAGGVGWADGDGNGEFAVAIRSALVRGDTALLYAGCGLVADSDPEVEYAETCAKLRPMRTALGID
ncbi:isochorismate synthase [Micromonospora sp. HM134]|uniref:isochorismate synthase n=1 Tax=unclassified Micromonospora TaxID=2617518 RepID=UPI0011984168|nr:MULTISPECIES: isochorismate synthase [unclassified Micromonospora]QDY07945.1 isochorismate synthase [Micromonospora sp. HM134]